MNRKNPFADPDALVDYGLRGRDIVVVNTPIPPRVPRRTPPRIEPVPIGAGAYILMDQTSKYALGVHALRDACIAENNANHPKHRTSAGQELYRPLTFEEGAIARLTEFHRLKNPDGSDRTLDERVKLMLRWNDSCTGAAYKAGTTMYKIIPVCEPLIVIDKAYNSGFLAVPYASLSGVELDSSLGMYGTHLTKQQIEDHEGWRAAFEGDVAVLRNYRDAVFEAIQLRRSDRQMPEKAMGFYVRQNTSTDELRALFVYDLGNNSDAVGNGNLLNLGSFVRLAPSKKILSVKS